MEAGRIRALIIEDNQDITANLYAFLEPLGYELDCSANGHIGLEMAVAGTFDVIVLDIMLPGMDGLAVCRALREEHVDPTPILMLTARDTVADRVTGFLSRSRCRVAVTVSVAGTVRSPGMRREA